jgi:hypothetical protein
MGQAMIRLLPLWEDISAAAAVGSELSDLTLQKLAT